MRFFRGDVLGQQDGPGRVINVEPAHLPEVIGACRVDYPLGRFLDRACWPAHQERQEPAGLVRQPPIRV